MKKYRIKENSIAYWVVNLSLFIATMGVFYLGSVAVAAL